jgi:hypothetical protein
MSIDKKQRRGFALGAVFALVAGMFGAVPASATPSTTAFTFAPAVGTSFNTLIDEDFHMAVVRDPAVVSVEDFDTYMKYEISTDRAHSASTFSVGVIAATHSGQLSAIPTSYAISSSLATYAGLQTIHQLGAAKTLGTYLPEFGAYYETASYVVTPSSKSRTATNWIGVQMMQYGAGLYASSESANVAVTVRAFLDLNGNNVFDSTLEPSGTQVINFLKYSGVTRTISVPAVEAGDTVAYANASVSGVNLEQLGGKWALRLNQFGPGGRMGSVSFSGVAEQTYTFSATLSRSFAIISASASNTLSAQLAYVKSGHTVFGGDPVTSNVDFAFNGVAASLSSVVYYAAAGTSTVASAGASSMTTYAVQGANVKDTNGWSSGGSVHYTVRANSTYTVRLSASGVLSTSAVTATFTFDNPSLDSTKYYSVNGGANVISGTHSAVTATVNATTGLADITIATAGFDTTDVLTVSAKISGLALRTIALQPVDLTYTITADATEVATAPNTAVAVGVTVKDQFGVKSASTIQRMKFSWTSGYGGTSTNSFVTLTAGEASTTMTPSRTPVTGSAVIKAYLQDYSANLANWSNNAATEATINVTVTDATNAFRVGLAASYSASISYGAVFSWSAQIGAPAVLVSGSPVVVSGPGLIFKDANGDTASDSITLPGTSNGVAAFYVTGRTAGSFPITLTSGAASTTSLIVIQPARSDAGASITWDTTTIAAGKTRIVTGTLVDANGNPVDTTSVGEEVGDSGTASLTVTYAGTAGVPVGTMPTETDADGQFKISILTSAADSGTFTLTATYNPSGAATAAADRVSSVQAITVGAGEATASSDQKVNAGSFKGYVAVYAKGYEGQRMSAKIGNDWVVVESLASNFERVVDFTGAGYTIAVRIYIDRVLVDTITVTTK